MFFSAVESYKPVFAVRQSPMGYKDRLQKSEVIPTRKLCYRKDDRALRAI